MHDFDVVVLCCAFVVLGKIVHAISIYNFLSFPCHAMFCVSQLAERICVASFPLPFLSLVCFVVGVGVVDENDPVAVLSAFCVLPSRGA